MNREIKVLNHELCVSWAEEKSRKCKNIYWGPTRNKITAFQQLKEFPVQLGNSHVKT